jgi:hypothetical protein
LDQVVAKSRALLQIYFDTSLTWSQRSLAFCHYLALPKTMLSMKANRGGKKHNKHKCDDASFNSNTTQNLPVNPPAVLPYPTRHRSKHTNTNDIPRAAAIARSRRLFQRWHIGRVARTLSNIAPLGDLRDPHVKNEMKAKHPHHDLDDEAKQLLEQTNHSEINALTPLELKRLVNKMNNGSGPGYDGWDVGLIKQLIQDPETAALHIRLLHDISNGRLLPPLARIIQRGRLVALTKKPAHHDAKANGSKPHIGRS